MQKKTFVVMFILFLSALVAHAAAQDASVTNEDEARLRQAVASYVTAFNAQDAKTMAQHWSADGVYVSNVSGEEVVGREAIAAELAEIFSGEAKRQLTVVTESIELLSPNVAIETGIAIVEQADQPKSETAYRATYVKRDGKWLIDRITENELPHQDQRYRHLSELEWIIGEWVDQAGEATIRFDVKWTKNRNFISRQYSVHIEGEIDASGLQIIGWDAQQKQIRSWLFDSSGGFVQGTWSKKGDRWYAKSVATLADGAAGSFTSIFRPFDENSYGWQKVQRIVDGDVLPSIDEVVVTREQ